MKTTFQYRQDLVHDPQRSTDVFKTFPRFSDVKVTQMTDRDSDIASMLLLLNLLPPTAGRKRTKISPSDAVDKVVHSHKSCCSIDEYLQEREGKQPYIHAIGRTQKTIDTFYITVDNQLILGQATSSLGAFDELFKSHYIFNLSYDESLVHFYTSDNCLQH